MEAFVGGGVHEGGIASVKFAVAVTTAEGAVRLLRPRAPYKEPIEGVMNIIMEMVGLRGLDGDRY